MTTVDPLTGEKGLEPLRTLATYRRQNGSVMFGMNATHGAIGIIRVGDVVRVETGD
ncbi:MAG: MOSC domain-containing protein [Gemmatimonadaceae bacterium]|nr:MOSC domain-containing protein [Gemmatimonadaceae bacterium]